MEKSYVQAVVELLESGSDIEAVLGNLQHVMKARGHAKALPAVLRALVRALEQGTTESVATVTVARVSDESALKADIKAALATLGVTDPHTVTVDDTIIGGIIATYNHRQIDQSYRTKLSSLYQQIVSN
jgi:F0F1-type ATP synthase delta subunit